MESLLTSPALIDLIIIFTMIEAVVLIVWRRRNAAGPPFHGVQDGPSKDERRLGRDRLDAAAGHLPVAGGAGGPGGGPWPWVPTALTAALVAHLLDLRSRWRG